MSRKGIILLLSSNTAVFNFQPIFLGGVFILVIFMTMVNAAFADHLAVISTINVGTKPVAIAVNESTDRAYVVNQLSQSVSVIDTTTDSVIDTISVGTDPVNIAISESAAKAYVVNREPDTVYVINTTTNTIIDNIPVGNSPFGIEINESTNRAYVGNFKSNTISVINTVTNSVIDTIPLFSGPNEISLNESTDRLYVIRGYWVSVINTVSNSVIDTFDVGMDPFRIAINESTERAYVTEQVETHLVYVIDTATNTVIDRFRAGEFGPGAIAVDESTDTAFATFSGGVYEIDTRTNTVVATIPVGNGPTDVAINESTGRVYVPDWQSDTVYVIGMPSIGPSGPVACLMDPELCTFHDFRQFYLKIYPKIICQVTGCPIPGADPCEFIITCPDGPKPLCPICENGLITLRTMQEIQKEFAPLKQIKAGFLPEEIVPKDGNILLIMENRTNPISLSFESGQKLIDMNSKWKFFNE